MVLTVRFDSATARPATSVDLVACAAISPIDAASSSIEPATVVTLTEAAPTEFSAVRASDETASAASLNPLEAFSRRPADSRSRSSACSTEARNSRIKVAIASPRRSRVALVSPATPARRSRSIILSRKTTTVRAMAPISSCACVAGNRRRRVAVGEPLHRAGQIFERHGNRAADAPAAIEPDQHHRQSDPDHEAPGLHPRSRKRSSSRTGAGFRRCDDAVGLRQHARGVAADQRQQRLDIVGARDPLRERIAVSLNLLIKLLLHRRRAVDGFEQRVEVLDLVGKVPLRGRVAGQPVFDLVAAHGEKRHRQLGIVGIRDPGQVVLDDFLDRIAGGDQVGGNALGFVEAQRLLRVHQAAEARLEIAHSDAQRHDGVLLGGGERDLDAIEAAHRHRLPVVEIVNRGV